MGAGPSRPRRRPSGEWDNLRSSFQLSELEDWELHGATWRAVELGPERIVLELCSCSGEPMDLVESNDRKLIEYVRNHELSER